MRNPFKSSYTKQELDMFSFLSQVSLFEDLTAKEKSYFLPYIHERNYGRNEAIFLRDDPSQALYIVKSGMIELNLDVNKGVERLDHVGRGKVIGENCLLKNTRRHYNAITVTETATLFVIPQDSLFFIFENHVDIRVKMLEALAIYNNQFFSKLSKDYRSSLGLFNLGQVFNKLNKK